jgi:hypothetical protein
VHALAIVPIWAQLARGLVPAVPAGVVLSWAFDQLARVGGWHTSIHGAAFGLVMFATLAPATAFSNALRLAGVRGCAAAGITPAIARRFLEPRM